MIAQSRQLYAGAIFAVIGGLGVLQAGNYRFGTATRMGPGYFPTCLSLLLVLLGLAAVLEALLRQSDPLPGWEWGDLVLLVLGVVLFALLIDPAGLLAASAGLIVPSCARRLRTRPLEILLLWAGLTVFAGVIFIRGFGLPFRWL